MMVHRQQVPCAKRSPLAAGRGEVLSFLLEIDDSLGYLLNRFIAAGVTSRARILMLAAWSGTERERFLRVDVRLNAFERNVVNSHLDRVMAEQSV